MIKQFNDDGTITITMTEKEYFESQFGAIQKESSSPESSSEEFSLEVEVTNFLSKLGMPRNIKGFNYSRAAITLSVEDPRAIDSITKVVYPTIAREFETTSSRAERAIRHAIEVVWDRGNAEEVEKLFGRLVNPPKGKVTNSRFIATVADIIRLKRNAEVKGGNLDG